jgi:hypothetical protein
MCAFAMHHCKEGPLGIHTKIIFMAKHNRSLKVMVQGLDFMAHPLYIHIYGSRG